MDIIEEVTPQIEDSSVLSLNIDNFEGPLDLLLELVKQANIEIKDIFVSQVTSQFIAFLSRMQELDFEVASEYLVMAATLIEIKTRSLLPTEVLNIDNSELEQAQQDIINKLEYQMLQKAGDKLKSQEIINRIYKENSISEVDIRYVAKDFTLSDIQSMFNQILDRYSVRSNDRLPKQIIQDSYTIAQQIAYIRDVLSNKNQVYFSELIGKDYSLYRLVVTFSAILELLRIQFITVVQQQEFGEILLKKNTNFIGEINYVEEYS